MQSYTELSTIYDNLIKEDVDYELWSKFIINKCNDYNVKREAYLDLACGTANLTEYISENFKNTWAVDLSPYMLSKAEKKLRGKGIKFLCQDIVNLDLNKRFDLATCCLDGTNYILDKNELLKFFKNVYNHLEDEGVFIFDINSYYKLSTVLGNNIFNYDDDDVVYIWENTFEDDILDMYLTFFIKKGEVYKRFDESHREKAYKEDEIKEILKEVGFKLREELSNYQNKKVEQSSERIVFIAQKLL